MAPEFEYLRSRGLNPEQLKAFAAYYDLLTQWNEKVNLTAITGAREIEIKHFVDSLILDEYPAWRRGFEDIGSGGGLRVVDVGSGAGFPGIPLKILRDNISLVILEASSKRVAFLEALIRELALTETEVFHLRAEQAGRMTGYRAGFDWALVRGVASVPVLLEYCLPFLKVGGRLAVYKGPRGLDEAAGGRRAEAVLGGKLVDIMENALPGGQGERRILIYKKVKSTPAKYPRGPGAPSKQPLV